MTKTKIILEQLYAPFQEPKNKRMVRNPELGFFLITISLLFLAFYVMHVACFGILASMHIFILCIVSLYFGFGYYQYFGKYAKCKKCKQYIIEYQDNYCRWCGGKQMQWF